MDISLDFVLRGTLVEAGQVAQLTVRATFASGEDDRVRVQNAVTSAGDSHQLHSLLRRASIRVFADENAWGHTIKGSRVKLFALGKRVLGFRYAYSIEDGRWTFTEEPPVQFKAGKQLGRYSLVYKTDDYKSDLVFAREREFTVPETLRLNLGGVTGEVERVVFRTEWSVPRVLGWLRPNDPIILPLGVGTLFVVAAMWLAGWQIPFVGSHATAAAAAAGFCGFGVARIVARRYGAITALGVTWITFDMLASYFGWDLPKVNTYHTFLVGGVVLVLFGAAPAVLAVLLGIICITAVMVSLLLAFTVGVIEVPAPLWIAVGVGSAGTALSVRRFSALRKRGGARRKQ